MCYADTTTENDGTVTAYCYCGWVEYNHTPESADAAAGQHQNRPDHVYDADDYAAAAV